VDLITVAQAVHWFDLPAFYREAERVLKPGGVLAVWAYAVFASTPEIDRVVDHLYRDVVGPFWPPDRGMIERGYEEVMLPFDPIAPPPFAMEKPWTAEDAIGYLGTWSATRGFIEAHGYDPVATVRDELLRAWGDGARTVRWPLYLKVARKAGCEGFSLAISPD
jgi:SAM-dependent methyltransferase